MSNMVQLRLLLPLIGCLTTVAAYDSASLQPKQVHIAFGDAPCTSMSVTWSTMGEPPSASVRYGLSSGNLSSLATGFTKTFVDQGPEKRAQFVSRVILKDLQPATTYWYRCGSEKGWSEVFSFRTANCSEAWSPEVVIFGDLGTTNAQIYPRLEAEVRDRKYDAVIHIGDLAYDMDEDNGRVGDIFMEQIKPVAANVPYMVCPGNHERAYNFSHIKERFTMPGNAESMFYTFTLGPARFISIDTEAYYYPEISGESIIMNQYNWLVEQLKEANKPENRRNHPWVIVYGHRPMYCSNIWPDDCGKNCKLRIGLLKDKWYNYGLEQLFYETGVDLAFWGHEHAYERLWPIYDFNLKNGSHQNPITNPGGPIHITTGAGGSKWNITVFQPEQPEWSAVRSEEYGYTILQIKNHTHFHVQQISVEKEGRLVDDFWIVKNNACIREITWAVCWGLSVILICLQAL